MLESLPYIGSTASVQIMRDQIVKDAVTTEMAQSWLSSLTFLPRFAFLLLQLCGGEYFTLFFCLKRPDEEVLEVFYSLLKFGAIHGDPKFVLTATTVAHTFCRNHPGCESSKGIQDIVDFLDTELKSELEKDVQQRIVRERVSLINGHLVSPKF